MATAELSRDVSLPPSVVELLRGLGGDGPSPEATRHNLIDRLSRTVLESRNMAVTHRMSSGIEHYWIYAEESYAGKDRQNQGEEGQASLHKGTAMSSPVTYDVLKDETQASTVFVRMTTRYTDVGAAKLGEVAISDDEKLFSMHPTPIPALEEFLDDETPVVLRDGVLQANDDGEPGEPASRDRTPQERAAAPTSGVSGGQDPGIPQTVGDYARENVEQAEKRTKKAETRLHDWMIEGGYADELRKVIFDMARLGVGVIKGPIPTIKKSTRVSKGKDADGNEQVTIEYVEDIIQGTECVSPWDIFPDPACGEVISEGDYVHQRADLTKRDVLKLMNEDGYDKARINQVLRGDAGVEGIVQIAQRAPGLGSKERDFRNTKFEAWYYYGMVSAEELQALSPDADIPTRYDEEIGEDVQVEELFAIVTHINDVPVKAAVAGFDPYGLLPFHNIPWQRRPKFWSGVGIPEQCRTPQRMLNGAVRATLNNAGVTAGGQIVIDDQAIYPADKQLQIVPNKIWYKRSNMGPAGDKAFTTYEFPNVVDKLIPLIELSLRFFEESTNIPLVTQGQSGKTQHETLGGMELQNSNANQLLRSVADNLDGYGTKKIVHGMYEELLLDEDVPADEKGDSQILAKGSRALVDRHIQNQFLQVFVANAVQNPEYGINPKLYMEKVLRANRIVPSDIQYTEAEQQRLMEARAQQADPRIEAEKIKAEVALQIAQMKAKMEGGKLQADMENKERDRQQALRIMEYNAQIEAAKLQIQVEGKQDDVMAKLADLEERRAKTIQEIQSRNKLSDDGIKAHLAETMMELDTQIKLSLAQMGQDEKDSIRRATPEVATPRVEPKPRAKTGAAYQG